MTKQEKKTTAAAVAAAVARSIHDHQPQTVPAPELTGERRENVLRVLRILDRYHVTPEQIHAAERDLTGQSQKGGAVQ